MCIAANKNLLKFPARYLDKCFLSVMRTLNDLASSYYYANALSATAYTAYRSQSTGSVRKRQILSPLVSSLLPWQDPAVIFFILFLPAMTV
jgi:hypothetical protein